MAGSGEPLQILSTTDENTFEYFAENLEAILAKVPESTKVAVVSVVGGFRSGKSFLLSLFVRYLQYCEEREEEPTQAWMVDQGERLVEGNSNEGQGGRDAPPGFKWRGGSDRQTTGIWMWSEPFMRFSAIEGKEIAVLLVDTQGMFDNETTMSLTSCIFGLSTMISSYQIYNVEKRISEDNLQHLAMFAEYGRIAVAHDGNDDDDDDGSADLDGDEDAAEDAAAESKAEPTALDKVPFQRLEFLIRDWQDFEDEEDVARCEREINQYWHRVKDMDSRSAEDLRSTREQIAACFRSTTAFALPHPGTKVTKKTYDGDLSVIDGAFRALLNRYVRRVFGAGDLDPKSIYGHSLSVMELKNYMDTYTELFKDGTFPEAQTMLDATVRTNNANATQAALGVYRRGMDVQAGPSAVSYVPSKTLSEAHDYHKDKALAKFHEIATMGSKRRVRAARDTLLLEISSDWDRYDTMNRERNPLKNIETLLVPGFVALMSIVLRFFSDTCSGVSSTCRSVSDGLAFVQMAVLLFVLISNFRFMQQLTLYLRDVYIKVAGGQDLMTTIATTTLPPAPKGGAGLPPPPPGAAGLKED